MNLEPTGSLSSTLREPLCSATIRLAMARPRPVPRSFVEKCGRKRRSLSSGEMPWPVSAISISTASPSSRRRVYYREAAEFGVFHGFGGVVD